MILFFKLNHFPQAVGRASIESRQRNLNFCIDSTQSDRARDGRRARRQSSGAGSTQSASLHCSPATSAITTGQYSHYERAQAGSP